MWHGSSGKRGLLSLFAPKFPVVRINHPKTGACFPVFAFSIIAGYKCLQTPLAPHIIRDSGHVFMCGCGTIILDLLNDE